MNNANGVEINMSTNLDCMFLLYTLVMIDELLCYQNGSESHQSTKSIPWISFDTFWFLVLCLSWMVCIQTLCRSFTFIVLDVFPTICYNSIKYHSFCGEASCWLPDSVVSHFQSVLVEHAYPNLSLYIFERRD